MRIITKKEVSLYKKELALKSNIKKRKIFKNKFKKKRCVKI